MCSDLVNAQGRRRRVWCETLSYTRLRDPSLLGRVSNAGVGIILAVRPSNLEALPETVRAVRAAGIELDVWPMLGNDVGRWAHVGNAGAFRAFATDVVQRVRQVSAAPFRTAVDLEPSWGEVDAWLSARSRGVIPGDGPLGGHVVGTVGHGASALWDSAARGLVG